CSGTLGLFGMWVCPILSFGHRTTAPQSWLQRPRPLCWGLLTRSKRGFPRSRHSLSEKAQFRDVRLHADDFPRPSSRIANSRVVRITGKVEIGRISPSGTSPV